MFKITVADYLIEKLARVGLKHMFFLPGGGCMYLVDALARSSKMQGIALLHEQSVGIAAEAYAQFTNKLSACLVTTGPGATNALTPCAAAWTDSTPMLFISGQVKTSDNAKRFGVRQLGFQEVPIIEIVSPITKKAIQLDWSMNIPKVIEDLLHDATSGRPGPVWLDIPLDIQNAVIEVNSWSVPSQDSATSHADSVPGVEKMVSDWKSAKRPLLLIGNGVRLSNESARVSQLMQATQTPALLTWKMIDFLSEQDPLNAGRPGSMGQRHANILQQNSDFILCLGSRLDLGQVAYRLDNFAPAAKRYICEVDSREVSKLLGHFVAFNMDISDFLDSVEPVLFKNLSDFPDRRTWKSKIKTLKDNFSRRKPFPRHTGQGVDLYDFIHLLSKNLSTDHIIVPGSSGACSELVMQSFEVKVGQRVLNSEGLGPMGFGLPAVLGVSIASDRKQVVSIDGDGGFLMNIQELISLKYNNIPATIFILNNNGYGSIRSTQKAYFDGRYLGIDSDHGLGLPNWQEMIMGFEVDFCSLKSLEELETFFENWNNVNDPLVVEIKVTSSQVVEPRVATRRSNDGLLQTDDMEDMSPKLSPDELSEIRNFLLSESNPKNWRSL
jgi:acetolactate synthase-1/2/3 large subunit